MNKGIALFVLLVVSVFSSSAAFASTFKDVPFEPLKLPDAPPPSDQSFPARRSTPVVQVQTEPEPFLRSGVESDVKVVRASGGSTVSQPNSESPNTSSLGYRLPALNDFVASVKSAQSDAITGVYVHGILALRVVPQPENRPTYVSFEPGVATLYCGLGPCGSIGLLAHNQLSGILFTLLAPQQEVVIVRGGGSTTHYRVSSIRTFQALDPRNPYSSYVDLSNRATLSGGELFQQVYGAGNQVVFQTCLAYGGDPTWGRLFVIADPVSDQKN